MTSIIGIGTALPKNHYSRSDLNAIGGEWLSDDVKKRALFERFLASSKAEGRNFCIPAPEILNLNGMHGRASLFEEHGSTLGSQALADALDSTGVDKNSISSLVFTSCSCPSIPSIDALIIDSAGLNRTTRRIPVYQHGCAGGVVGLQIGSRLCSQNEVVCVTSVELCSLVFQKESPATSQLVGAAIFADGASSVLLSSEERGLVIRATESFLVPETRHLMGYDIFDDGFYLRLDSELPKALAHVAPDRIAGFLAANSLNPSQVQHWLFHPGGTKILDYLENIFSLKPDQGMWSRSVLSRIGNLSSATIHFVIKGFLDSQVCKVGEHVLIVGIGPGLTIELILCEWVGA